VLAAGGAGMLLYDDQPGEQQQHEHTGWSSSSAVDNAGVFECILRGVRRPKQEERAAGASRPLSWPCTISTAVM
jgi:hypothetical protein